MGEPARKLWTVDEFLAWENEQPDRFELVHGQERAMVGGSFAHNGIIATLARLIGNALEGGPCVVVSQGQKLKVQQNFFYPDVLVTCSRPADAACVLEEAVLIAEVLSPTTAQYDIMTKAPLYRTLPSLRHLLIVAQDSLHVELYTREARGWHLDTVTTPDESLDLTALDMTLRLADLYRGTDLLQGP